VTSGSGRTLQDDCDACVAGSNLNTGGFGEATTRTQNPTLEPPTDAADRAHSCASRHRPKLPLDVMKERGLRSP
jgi:hypothetical protein